LTDRSSDRFTDRTPNDQEDLLSTSFSNPIAEATAKAVSAVQKAQTASVVAGFELAGQLLEQQRVATLALLDAFASASPARKG
jgi:hypothetical protein